MGSGIEDFSVIWSEDESAFVYTTIDIEYNDTVYAFYVHNYQPAMENIEVIEVYPEIRGVKHNFLEDYETPRRQKVYDISDDGDWLLLLARKVDLTNFDLQPLYVVAWNTQNPDESYLVDNVKPETVKGMSFAGDSHSELLIVNEDGLIHYNLLTGTQTVLDASIQPTHSHFYFSPNSQYLAITCCWTPGIDVEGLNITILDLNQAVTVPTAMPAFTATFTPVPLTPTNTPVPQPPISNPGVDQTFISSNGISATITLDASASTDPDGTISTFEWTENGQIIATGATPTLNLRVGTHTITLTVTDNNGLTASDTVQITVEKE